MSAAGYPDGAIDDLPDHLEPTPANSDGQCVECGRRVTIGDSGVEYGHAQWAYEWSGGYGDRCSYRPDVVDSSHPAATPATK